MPQGTTGDRRCSGEPRGMIGARSEILKDAPKYSFQMTILFGSLLLITIQLFTKYLFIIANRPHSDTIINHNPNIYQYTLTLYCDPIICINVLGLGSLHLSIQRHRPCLAACFAIQSLKSPSSHPTTFRGEAWRASLVARWRRAGVES